MAELADYLRSEIPKEIGVEDQEAWKLFEERIQMVSLEETLREIPLSPQLINLVIEKTWDYIFPVDRKSLRVSFKTASTYPSRVCIATFSIALSAAYK